MSFLEVLRFLGRRLLALPVVLFVISLGVFSLLYLAPGGVEAALLGNRPATPEIIRAIRDEYHLDDPFLTQYWLWLQDALRLDFGRSIKSGEPVFTVIGRGMTTTLFLSAYAFIIAMTFGVGLGVLAAVRRRTIVDRGVVGLSVFSVSAPAFATGIFLLYLFSVRLGWFPVFGQGSGFVDRVWHLTLPALALALSIMALVVKLTRAGMIGALEQDYVAFARARGVSSRNVLVKYAFRNALVPIVTAGGVLLAFTLTGATLVEVTFSLPGIGSRLVEAASFKDVPVVQGIAMTFAITIVIVNVLVDLMYVLVDPRIRFGKSAA